MGSRKQHVEGAPPPEEGAERTYGAGGFEQKSAGESAPKEERILGYLSARGLPEGCGYDTAMGLLKKTAEEAGEGAVPVTRKKLDDLVAAAQPAKIEGYLPADFKAAPNSVVADILAQLVENSAEGYVAVTFQDAQRLAIESQSPVPIIKKVGLAAWPVASSPAPPKETPPPEPSATRGPMPTRELERNEAPRLSTKDQVLDIQRALDEHSSHLRQVEEALNELAPKGAALTASLPASIAYLKSDRERLLGAIALGKEPQDALAKFDEAAAKTRKTFDDETARIQAEIAHLKSTVAGLTKHASDHRSAIATLTADHRSAVLKFLAEGMTAANADYVTAARTVYEAAGRVVAFRNLLLGYSVAEVRSVARSVEDIVIPVLGAEKNTVPYQRNAHHDPKATIAAVATDVKTELSAAGVRLPAR